MSLSKLRRFAGNDMVYVTRYLSGEISRWANDVFATMANLTFRENFACDRQVASGEASAAINVPNRFGTADVDICFMNETGPFRIDSVTKNNIVVVNTGASTAAVTIYIFKR